MCILLEMEGFKVISLSDTSFARRKLESQDIALVMLDINLGGEKGNQLCHDIKQQTSFQHIPVILVSADANIASITAECGADDYLVKPFELQTFIDKVHKFADTPRTIKAA